ncbi:MAG: serine protease [Planctomycetia bacterium]
MQHRRRLGTIAVVAWSWALVAHAQSVCLPQPRLLTLMPMGVTAGGQVDVAVTGERIEDASVLLFSHPGLSATPKTDAEGKPVPGSFVVKAAGDMPPGVYDVAAVTALGVSAPRAFTVGTLPETVRSAANTKVETATPLSLGCVSSTATTPQAIDHYRLEAYRGQRIVVECAARGIDSRLQPVLALADAKGRDLVVERRGGIIDFTVPEDAAYVVKVHDLSFQGGAAFFYRLVVQEVAAGAVAPRHPSVRGVSSFSWPPSGLPEQAAVTEIESNDGSAQAITLPADIAGALPTPADVDTYEFEATEGDVWWIEAASARLGGPTDLAVVVQRVTGAGGDAEFEDVAEVPDIASPVKLSSNHYAYDGPPYDAGSPDVLGRVEIKKSGRHRIQVRDLFGGTRAEPRSVYRLIVRRAAPDFALVAWALHKELRNGDRNDLSKPPALRPGATMAFEVVAIRRDGFDGEIALSVEDLPPGVTATGFTIPKSGGRGIVLLTAAEDAAAGFAPLRISGRATVADAAVVRPCAIASVAWPVRDHWQEIPMTRLVPAPIVSVGVAERAPLSLEAAAEGPVDAVAGTTLTLPLRLVKRGEFSGGLLQVKAFGAGFEGLPAFDIPLAGDGHETAIDLEKLKIPPGDHTIALYGTAIVKYRPPAKPGAEPPAAVDTAEIVVSRPIRLRVAAPPAAAATPAPQAAPQKTSQVTPRDGGTSS